MARRSPATRPNARLSASATRTIAPFLGLITLAAELVDGKHVGWAQVAKVGKFWDPRYGNFSFTPDDLAQMLANFKAGVVGTDIPFDFNHGTSRPDSAELGKSAGWFKDLQLRADGQELWALVAWTEQAAEMIAAQEYRYVSPTIHYSFKPSEGDRRGQNVGTTLTAAALTNTPVLDMAPLALSRGGTIELAAADDEAAEAIFSYDEQRRRVQAALSAKFSPYGMDDYYGPCYGVYLVDLFDGLVVYRTYDGDTYQIGFALGADGTVTFTGDPVECVYAPKPLASQETPMSRPNTAATVTVKDAQGKDVVLSRETVIALVQAEAPAAPAAESIELTKKVTDLTAVVQSQGATIVELTHKNAEITLARQKDTATAEIDALVRAGKVLPNEREGLMALAIKDHDMFVSLTKDRPRLIDLDREIGSGSSAATGATPPGSSPELEAAIKIERDANAKLTREQAYSLALTKNPSLYKDEDTIPAGRTRH